MAVKVTYEVEGLDGVIEMIDELLDPNLEQADKGRTTAERQMARAAANALELLKSKLERTTIVPNGKS
jgi:hypothetical protein